MKNNSIFNDKKFLDIISCNKVYHFINKKLIKSNYMSDRFYVKNKYNIYFTII